MVKAKEDRIFDALIIGGGPAGLNAALVLGRACRRVALIDNGLPRNRAARVMHGFIGRDGSDPRALLEQARKELVTYSVELINDAVIDAEAIQDINRYKIPTGFTVATKSGRRLQGRKILFTTGMVDDLPKLPGLEACYGITVHHCPYCDGWEHRGKRVVAYGRRAKAAVGLGITLRGWSDQVTVLSDGAMIDEGDKKRLVRNGIAWRDERVLELIHESGRLTAVRFENAPALAAESLFFNTGQRPHSELPRKFGCDFDDSGRAHTHERQKFEHPGVFVAGDAAGEVQLIIVAAAEGAIAALAMNRELQDEDRGEADQT